MEHSTDEVRPVTVPQTVLGEGVRWDARRHELLWVDITEGRLFRGQVTADGTVQPVRGYRIDRPLGAAAPVAGRSGWVLAAGRGFAHLDEDGTLTPIAEPAPGHVRMNDAACDPQGRFWGGTLAHDQEPGAGAVYRLDRDGSCTTVLEGLTIANGLGWSPDGTTMYLADSGPRQVLAFAFDPEAGTLSDRRVLIEIDEDDGAPDGLTVDSAGDLWVAVYGGGQVRRYRPDGALAGRVTLPAPQTTSCAFGPPDGTRLFVTTATEDYSDEQRRAEPLAGRVFATATDATGSPANPFRPEGTWLR